MVDPKPVWIVNLIDCGWYDTYDEALRETSKHERMFELLRGVYDVTAESGEGVIQIADGNEFKWIDREDTRKFLYHQ